MKIDYVVLLDVYGGILSKGQREALDLRYNSDLTLSEIAEEMGGVSRQSVNDFIKKGEKRLEELESSLGILARLKRAAAVIAGLRGGMAELKRDYRDERFSALENALLELEEQIWGG